MIALSLLLAQTAVAPAPAPAVTPGSIVAPADLSTLPVLQLMRRAPAEAIATFVRDEVRAGRCVLAPSLGGTTSRRLRLELAVLVSDRGQVRRLLPRAIGCPTVEQYATGVVSRRIRGNIMRPATPGWYQTSISFSWPR